MSFCILGLFPLSLSSPSKLPTGKLTPLSLARPNREKGGMGWMQAFFFLLLLPWLGWVGRSPMHAQTGGRSGRRRKKKQRRRGEKECTDFQGDCGEREEGRWDGTPFPPSLLSSFALCLDQPHYHSASILPFPTPNPFFFFQFIQGAKRRGRRVSCRHSWAKKRVEEGFFRPAKERRICDDVALSPPPRSRPIRSSVSRTIAFFEREEEKNHVYLFSGCCSLSPSSSSPHVTIRFGTTLLLLHR